jgi:hypothetical protein
MIPKQGLLVVIAGLDPAIHLPLSKKDGCAFRKRMDARVKPAHDAGVWSDLIEH